MTYSNRTALVSGALLVISDIQWSETCSAKSRGTLLIDKEKNSIQQLIRG